MTFHVILGECLVVAGDESPVEDDAYLEADPDVHQAVEDDQTGKGKLKKMSFVLICESGKSNLEYSDLT